MLPSILLFLLGLLVLVVGSELVVRGPSKVAAFLNVSPMVIGLTIVAMGTSAPELVTTIVSTVRG